MATAPAPAPPAFKTTSHLYAGFLGGLVSSVALQPLDLLKTRVQQSTSNERVFDVVRNLSSPAELWRGTLPSAIRTSVGASLYLTSLGKLRTALARGAAARQQGYSSQLPQLSMASNLAAGSLARGFVGFLTMPVTVLKVRYESSLYHYSSMANAVKSMYREGGIRLFWAGYGATFTRDAPYAGLYVLFYEQAKQTLNTLIPTTSSRTGPQAAALNSSAAALSAVLATTVTAPFDTIKTKLQLEPQVYRSFFPALKQVFDQSPRALFDGLSLRLTRKALSAGVSWCIYEELVRRLDRYGSML